MKVGKKRESIKHNNRGNRLGGLYYCQVIRDKWGYVVKTIWHRRDGEIFKLKRHKSRLRASMKNQPK